MKQTTEVSKERGDGHVLVAVSGEVDMASAPQLWDRLQEAVAEGSPIVIVDLVGVTFIDSTALGVLIEGRKLCDSQGGTMRIAISEAQIIKIFEITGLTELFDIYPTRDQAIVG